MRSWDAGLSLRVRLQTGVQCYKYVSIVAVGRRDGSRRARLLRWKDLWVVEVVARRCGLALCVCVCVCVVLEVFPITKLHILSH